MSMLIKELKELQLRSEVICIARDCSEDVLYGQICKVGDDYVAMHVHYPQ